MKKGAGKPQYGIWNSTRKCWQFDICEDTPMLARARLFQKIGDDARKWRFETKALPESMCRPSAEARIKELEEKLEAAAGDLESACASLPAGAQCSYCAHYPCSDERGSECGEASQWKWRGFGKEEGK